MLITLKKLLLIGFIGWLSMVSIPGKTWANGLANSPSTALYWLAQSETNVQVMPAAQPKLNLSTEAAEPLAEPLTSGSTSDSTLNSTSAPTSAPAQQRSPDQQAPSATERSPSKPFNPYDMKALKQFDQGSHRQQ